MRKHLVLALAMTVFAACGKGGIGTGPSGQPNITFFGLDQSSVQVGQATVIAWTVDGSGSCTASGDWSGTKSMRGRETVGPYTAGSVKRYTLTCGSSTASTSLLVGDGGSTSGGQVSPDGLVTVVMISKTPAVGPLIPGQPQMLKLHVENRADDQLALEVDVFGAGMGVAPHTTQDLNFGSSSGSKSGSWPTIHLKAYYSTKWPQVAWTMELPGW